MALSRDVLVNEAGQAMPQSAVGLLMRARKAVVVGAPLQIPPVVSLPQRLIVEVAKYFGVSQAQWLAPEASVQAAAEEAARAGFRVDVGVPEVALSAPGRAGRPWAPAVGGYALP